MQYNSSWILDTSSTLTSGRQLQDAPDQQLLEEAGADANPMDQAGHVRRLQQAVSKYNKHGVRMHHTVACCAAIRSCVWEAASPLPLIDASDPLFGGVAT